GDEELTDCVAELTDARVVAPRDLPRRSAGLVDSARGFFAALLGDLVHTLAVMFAGARQAFVLEQLQGRVDGARTRTPRARGLLPQALDHVVAVAGFLREDREECGADVAPAHAAAPAATLPALDMVAPAPLGPVLITEVPHGFSYVWPS